MPPIGGMVLTDILLLALVAYDLRTLGRLHEATKWGGAFFLVTQAARIVLNLTPAWQAFTKGLIG
jgi:proline racemase